MKIYHSVFIGAVTLLVLSFFCLITFVMGMQGKYGPVPIYTAGTLFLAIIATSIFIGMKIAEGKPMRTIVNQFESGTGEVLFQKGQLLLLQTPSGIFTIFERNMEPLKNLMGKELTLRIRNSKENPKDQQLCPAT